MAADNLTWGEEHISNDLKLKLGIRVSPRTVRKYLAGHRGRTPDPSQRWLTFVHNHAQAIVACDFFVVFTARFRILYVFVIMELGRRQILHHNVTAHPSAEWTLQQFREAVTEEHPYRLAGQGCRMRLESNSCGRQWWASLLEALRVSSDSRIPASS